MKNKLKMSFVLLLLNKRRNIEVVVSQVEYKIIDVDYVRWSNGARFPKLYSIMFGVWLRRHLDDSLFFSYEFHSFFNTIIILPLFVSLSFYLILSVVCVWMHNSKRMPVIRNLLVSRLMGNVTQYVLEGAYFEFCTKRKNTKITQDEQKMCARSDRWYVRRRVLFANFVFSYLMCESREFGASSLETSGHNINRIWRSWIESERNVGMNSKTLLETTEKAPNVIMCSMLTHSLLLDTSHECHTKYDVYD